MPDFGASFFAWLATTVTVYGVAVVTYGQLLLFGASLAFSTFQQRKMKRQARDAYNASQVDRLANIQSTIAPRDLVLGTVRKTGVPFFKGSTGFFSETLVVAYALAGHEITAVDELWLNDVKVDLASDGSGRFLVASEPYNLASSTPAGGNIGPSGTLLLEDGWIAGSMSGVLQTNEGSFAAEYSIAGNVLTSTPGAMFTYQVSRTAASVRVWWSLGAPGQVADARMMALFPTLWTANHKATGVPCLYLELKYSETAFPSNVPSVSVLMRGAKCFDPRTGVTAFSENPAVLMRYVYTHPQFGRQVVTATEDARLIAAANACDVSHAYVVNGVTQPARPMFQSAIVAPYGTAARDMFDDLAQAMGGMWAYAGGELFVRAGVYSAPVLSLGERDLAVIQRDGEGVTQSPISISVHQARVKKFNVVNPRIWNEDQQYKQVPLEPLKAPALIARDGEELAQEMSFPGIASAPQALHVAGIAMRDARDPLTVALPFKMTAYPLELFDTISLTVARYGWPAGKNFVILDKQWGGTGFVILTLKETAAQIYQPDADFLAGGYAENTALPKPWLVPVPGPLILSSGTNELIVMSDGTVLTRVRVTWPAINDARVTEGGQVRIKYRDARITFGPWEEVTVDGAQTETFVYNVEDGQFYNFQAQAWNGVAWSAPSLLQQHYVVGKTEPPPDVEAFTVFELPDGARQYYWSYPNPPADLKGFIVRYAPVFGPAQWDGMIPFFESAALERSKESIEPPDGEYTIAIKAVDTSGNESANAFYISVLLEGATVGTQAYVRRPYELAWPGIKIDCYVDGYILDARSTTVWDTAPTPWDAWRTWRGISRTPIVYIDETISLGSVQSARLKAAAWASGPVVAEYQSSLDGSLWTEWAEIPVEPVSMLYVRVRWIVTGPDPQLYRAQITTYI